MNYPLRLPRRHRRRLFFPPGLLALAWLLWLGCEVIRPHINLTEGIIQFTVPRSACNADAEESHTGSDCSCYSKETVARMLPWQTFQLSGNTFANYHILQRIEAAYPLLQTSFDNALCLRIQLNEGTPYATLLRLLNHVQQHNLHNYWLDLRPDTVTTLYIVGNKNSFSMPCTVAAAPLLPGPK